MSWVGIDLDVVNIVVCPEPSLIVPHVTNTLTTPVEQLDVVESVDACPVGSSIVRYLVLDLLHVDWTLPANCEWSISDASCNTTTIVCYEAYYSAELLVDVSVVLSVTYSIQNSLCSGILKKNDITCCLSQSCNRSISRSSKVCCCIECSIVEQW